MTKTPTYPHSQTRKRVADRAGSFNPRCFICKQTGHKTFNCPTKSKTSDSTKSVTCTFCKKPGHTENVCFAKERSGQRNDRNVNFCREPMVSERSNDITTAVIQGVPVDVLIDSGAINVSLISSDVLKHLLAQQNLPIAH